ncbi:MAG: hypothetical protein QXI33_00700 [Candidatus Pacearchaeota archaeon]
MNETFNEGDLIICIVKDIVKTTVFVETESGVKGSIVFSEVAPGRIRNIREYAVPNKIIVCKILEYKDNHLFLSLRRVKEKERKDLLEKYKKEKSYFSILKKILGHGSVDILDRIKREYGLIELIEEARKNPKILERYFEKSKIPEIEKVISEKKERVKEIRQEFILKCKEPNGIKVIKNILAVYDNITYLGSSKYVIKISSNDLKKADSQINSILETIEKNAKKEKCEFSLKK